MNSLVNRFKIIGNGLENGFLIHCNEVLIYTGLADARRRFMGCQEARGVIDFSLHWFANIRIIRRPIESAIPCYRVPNSVGVAFRSR